MSKKAKAAAKEKRLQQKRALKMANKAKYASWKSAGENGKGRSGKKRSSISLKGKHPFYCGNVACKKCFTHYDDFIIKKH